LPGGENDSAAYDINLDGTVVGFSSAADGIRHAVRWNADGAGTIVGQADTQNHQSHATEWRTAG
jgi:probable HAF family extracellular repeat protein